MLKETSLFWPLGIMFETHVLYALAALFAGPILYFYRKESNVGLWQVPGPFIARLTPLYRVYLLWSGECIDKFDKLHKQFGPVVRTGPNHIITSDPDAVFTIYDAGWRFPKVMASLHGLLHYCSRLQSDFYRVFALTYNGEIRDTVFSTRNMEYHKRMQSHVTGRFAPNILGASKAAIEDCIQIFVQRMTELAGQRIELGDWAKYWAFDTNSKMNFGQCFGFMAEGGDIKGIITGNDNGFHVGALIGQIPWLNTFFLENKVLMRFLACFAGITDPTADFVEVIYASTRCQKY